MGDLDADQKFKNVTTDEMKSASHTRSGSEEIGCYAEGRGCGPGEAIHPLREQTLQLDLQRDKGVRVADRPRTWKNYTFNDYFGTVEKSLFKLIREGGFGEYEQESRQIRFSKHRKVINGWRLIPSRDVHRDGSDGSLATQVRRENQVLQ